MPKNAEELIVRNLAETVHQLQTDLDRIEFWAAALAAFQTAVPHYQAGAEYLLPSRRVTTHS